jgi:hypothetical protein
MGGDPCLGLAFDFSSGFFFLASGFAFSSGFWFLASGLSSTRDLDRTFHSNPPVTVESAN